MGIENSVMSVAVCQVMPTVIPSNRILNLPRATIMDFFFLHTLPSTIAFKLKYILSCQSYAKITTFFIKKCSVRLLSMTMSKHLVENSFKYWRQNKTNGVLLEVLLQYPEIAKNLGFKLFMQKQKNILHTISAWTSTNLASCNLAPI